MAPTLRTVSLVVISTLLLFGCNYPASEATIPAASSPTLYVQTLSALQTRAVLTATSQGFSGVFPTSAPVTFLPVTGGTTGTPATPVVTNATILNDTLCWVGPGPRFTTISAIFKGFRVAMAGRASIPGWVIILDPIYLDPCWAQASDVKIDPSLNMAALPLFNAPLLPTTYTATAVAPASATSAPSTAPASTVPPPTAPPATATPEPPTAAPSDVPTSPPPTQPAPTQPAATGTP